MLELDLNELECVSGATMNPLDDRRLSRLQTVLTFLALIWDPIERVWRLRDPTANPQLSQMGIP